MEYSELDGAVIRDALITHETRVRQNAIPQRSRVSRLKQLGYAHAYIRGCHNRSIPSNVVPPHILGHVPPGYRPTYVHPLRMVSRLVHHPVNDNDIHLDKPFLYPNGLLLAKEYDLHITRRDRRITRRAAYRPGR